MCPASRSLITVDNLSNGEINAICDVADEMSADMPAQLGMCRGKIMASLFFEPSTRTRLSFETAMHRLGGDVITAADVGATSLAKGESIADMARVVGSYADIIVIRHPWEGSARVVADYSGVPVINAGDGGHEHPTQTLCDLYTIRKERKSLQDLRIALWGDLKYGRTIHSLAYALARFGATIHFRPAPGLEIPEYVLRKLTTEFGGELKRRDDLDRSATGNELPLDAIYITPRSPHQLAMMPDVSLKVEMEKGVDALYVTRLQKERMKSGAAGGYPVIDKQLLKGKGYEKALVMHPLPRVNELAQEMDADRRSMYFKQAAWGVPVRMSLVAFLLGLKQFTVTETEDNFARKEYPGYRGAGLKCPNVLCVTVQESEAKYIRSEFLIIGNDPLILRCAYCDHEIRPPFIASSDWHEGRSENKKYHSASSHLAREIKPGNLVVFGSEAEAKAHGYKPSHFAGVPGARE